MKKSGRRAGVERDSAVIKHGRAVQDRGRIGILGFLCFGGGAIVERLCSPEAFSGDWSGRTYAGLLGSFWVFPDRVLEREAKTAQENSAAHCFLGCAVLRPDRPLARAGLRLSMLR